MFSTHHPSIARKFKDLRETDLKQYEMEKRFLEDQRMRHLKTEMKRKKELETIEAEKAKRATVNVKHPMSEDAAKDVWEEKENDQKLNLTQRHSLLLMT